MAGQLIVDDAQFQKLISEIGRLGNHGTHWDYTNAISTVLGALLGFGAALLADRLKTQREEKARKRERGDKELTQLNATNTMMAFNIETLIHTVKQQVIPHYRASNFAMSEISLKREKKADTAGHIISSSMQEAMRRCPQPNLLEGNFFADLSFLLDKDPDLLKRMAGSQLIFEILNLFLVSAMNLSIKQRWMERNRNYSLCVRTSN